jgi:predicted DNA-binding ribbon-helix-helix protein
MFSETSVDFQWTTLRYIPEDRTLNVGHILGGLYESCKELLVVSIY